MNAVSISWYLSGLFLFSLIAGSAITVHPDAEMLVWALRGTSVGCCVLFAVLAIYLARLPKADATPGPRSRWLVKAYLGFAVVATVLVLLFTLG